MRHGGRRTGAGRPKQRTVLEVALSLSAPSAWEATPLDHRRHVGGDERVSAKYRPSAASVLRSSIPAAAVRQQEIDVNAGRARRSLSEIEWELVERYDAQTANYTTTKRQRSETHDHSLDDANVDEITDAFLSGTLHSVIVPRPQVDGGSSMSDFLTERFFDGTMQPTEIRGLKWVR